MAQPIPQDTFLFEVAPPKVEHSRSVEFMHADLARSGLTTADINVYPTLPQGFNQVGAYVITFADERMWTIRINQEKDKYRGPKGYSAIWYPSQLTRQELRNAPILYIVEGEKKAAKFYKQFKLPTIGIRGCYGYSTRRFSTDGTSILLPDLLELLTIGKTVKVIFDGDITTNIDIQMAAQRLANMLTPLYVGLDVYSPPEGKGADDWLVANPNASVEELINQPLVDMAISLKALYKQLDCVMHLDKDGIAKGPKLMELNALKLIEHRYGGRLSEDTYEGYIFDDNIVESQDRLTFQVLTQLQAETGEMWKRNIVAPAVAEVLTKNRSNILLDTIKTIQWDGVERLNTWASEYIEARNPKRYVEEWGRLLITSIILRLTQPGCKVDRLFGLTGRQGIGKTTFFRQLSEVSGKEYYYTLQHVPTGVNGDNITLYEGMRASLITDLDEGIFLSRASAEQIKSLISDTEGRYRMLNLMTLKTIKRNNIFVTTNNKAETLTDNTGSRRFAILRAEKINYLPYEIKIQLFAEALAKEKEIRKSAWYIIDEAAKTDNLDELTEVERNMTVEEYQNKEHQVPDDLTDWLNMVLSAPEHFARVAGMPPAIRFVTSGYLLHLLSRSSIPQPSQRYIGLRLIDQANNPYCHFKMSKYKGTESRFIFKDDNMRSMYYHGISNSQAQLSGFIIEPR